MMIKKLYNITEYIDQNTMKILLTNDDGIDAVGINSAYDHLSRSHEVYIIAPGAEQSACSNAITVHTHLDIKKISETKFSVSGFPADCVIIGMSSDYIPDVDLVIAGINHGPNVGDDIFFSGTVAGARTAHIFGKPALAVSVNCYRKPSLYIDEASRFLGDFIEEIADDIAASPPAAPKHHGPNVPSLVPFLNINYPDLPAERIRGKKYTYVGRRLYRDSFEHTVLDGNEACVRMGGYIESVHARGSDSTELDNGFITITPLRLDCTDYSYLEKKSQGSADG
jgi:5'-nucleotidase